MGSWLKTQYKLTTWRCKTLKIARTLRVLFPTSTNICKENTCSYLIVGESLLTRDIPDHKLNNAIKDKSYKPRSELWSSLSFKNLRNRRESKLEQRRRPMIPSVMRTYDKGVKAGQPEQWLWISFLSEWQVCYNLQKKDLNFLLNISKYVITNSGLLD